LVNGMHTVLAFMTLGELFAPDDGGREYILLKYTKIPRDSQRMCEAWRMARVAQLLEKYGTHNLMEWHGVETQEAAWDVLLEYGDNVLIDRFSETDDVVSRVLGGGVANRWLTRLRPTDTWLQDRLQECLADESAGEERDEISQFFAYAVRRDRQRAIDRGCSLEDAEWRGCEIEDEFDDACLPASVVSAYLSELTRDSRKFCSKELEITHKGLIKEQRKAGGKANAPGVLAAFARQKGRGI